MMTLTPSPAAVKGLFMLGTTTSAFAAGTFLFTSYAHIPGYIQSSDDENLLKQWQTMGAVGKATLPPLILITTGAHFLNSYLSPISFQRYRFLTAGLLSLLVLPYTAVMLAPVNIMLGMRETKKEEASDSDLKHMSNKELIKRWGSLNAVRGLLMIASTIVSYDALLRLSY